MRENPWPELAAALGVGEVVEQDLGRDGVESERQEPRSRLVGSHRLKPTGSRFTQRLRSPRLPHTAPDETPGCTQLPGGNPHAQDTHHRARRCGRTRHRRGRRRRGLHRVGRQRHDRHLLDRQGVADPQHARARAATARPSRSRSGRYTGTADFAAPAADLGGPLTIDARTTYSTTDGLGYVEGSFRVKDDRRRLGGRFTGTLKGSKLVGFLTASSRGNHARVLGNLSATFVPATGFTAGAIGSTSSTAVLAVVAGPICPKPKPDAEARAEAPCRVVEGKVSAVGDGSVGSTITVATRGPSTATCTRDATSARDHRHRRRHEGRDEVRVHRHDLDAPRARTHH